MSKKKQSNYRGLSWDEHGNEWIASVTVKGKRVRKRAGRNKAEAIRVLRELRASLGAPSRPTLKEYAPAVFERKARHGNRNVHREEQQLVLHVLPLVGDKELPDIARGDVLRIIETMMGNGLSGSTVGNVIGVLRTILQDAGFHDLLEQNVAAQIPRYLMPKANPSGLRDYSPNEVRTLLTDERIPLERRVLYAVQFFLGLRIGEACARRFRDMTPQEGELDAMVVRDQWDGQPLKAARGDDVALRMVPIHPQLKALLAQWKLSGFEATYGRNPTDDDLLVPNPTGDSFACFTSSSITKHFKRDCIRLGVEPLGSHSLRKAFISMLVSAGVSYPLVDAMTHNSKTERRIVARYATVAWDAKCEAVLKLDMDLSEGRVVQLHGSN